MKIAKPSKEINAGKQFQYLDLPKTMDDCYYAITLDSFGLTKNEDKLAAEFKIDDTDTKLKGKGSILLNPSQKFAAIYFWQELFNIHLALAGKQATDKRMKKLAKKFRNPDIDAVIELLTEQIGQSCHLAIVLRADDDGGEFRKTKKLWTPTETENEDD